MPSSNSAIDYGPITVAPTDRIIFFAWIATSTGDAGSYARLGMDFVDSATNRQTINQATAHRAQTYMLAHPP